MPHPYCRLLTMALLSSVLALAARAADAPPPGQDAPAAAPAKAKVRVDPQERLEQLRQSVLELVDDGQKQKVEDLFRDAMQEIQSFQADAQRGTRLRREVVQKLAQTMEDLRQQLSSILPAPQLRKLRSLMGGMGKQAGQGANGGPASGLLAALTDSLTQLDLSAAQKQKLAEVQADARQRIVKLRSEFKGDRQALAAKTREMMLDIRQQVLGLLTPQQQQKIDTLMPENGGGRKAKNEK